MKLAKELLAHPGQLQAYLDRAEGASSEAQGKLRSVYDEFKAMVRMLKAWMRREYTEVPKKTLIRALFSVLYFLLVVDAIPDFIPGIGLVDDLTVIAWVLKGIREDLRKFVSWEQSS